jgi:Protein of unknown function (DUF1353)
MLEDRAKGVDMRQAWSWKDNTTPFSSDDPQHPGLALFKLRQIDDDRFELLEPFSYTRADGTTIPVDEKWLRGTDLASIPTFLGWFARRHGRHTPAALLHDQLIRNDDTQAPPLPPQAQLEPVEADLEFRKALRASGVALVKSWVLWTGVTLGTRWERLGRWPQAATVAWFAAALAGTGLLVYGLTGPHWLWVTVALVAPVPFAGLWGRQWRAGLIAGYAFWPVFFGSAPPFLAYQVYRAAERLASALGRLRPEPRQTVLPPPPSYSKR